jgi:ribosomal protein L24E
MKCSYCGNEIPRAHGTMFVHKTGKLSYYCSGKCYRGALVNKKKMTFERGN